MVNTMGISSEGEEIEMNCEHARIIPEGPEDFVFCTTCGKRWKEIGVDKEK